VVKRTEKGLGTTDFYHPNGTGVWIRESGSG
jgi:hypothetical protein